MRLLTTLVSSALMLVLANAQTNTTSTTSAAVLASTTTAVVSGTASLNPAQSSQAACLAACPATDPNCRAKCITIPEGVGAQQNATIECISNCFQGDGSAADNLAYENCQKDCIASATVTPASTAAPTAAATGSGSGSDGTAKTTATTGTDAGAVSTSTSSASPSSTSKGAADTIRVGASLAGVVGVFAAMLTL